LFYATAGIVVARLDHGNFAFTSASNTQVGPVVGIGLERVVAPLWTVKAEYLYAPMNGGTACDLATCGFLIENDKFDLHVFRIGLNRHFGPATGANPVRVAPNSWTGFYLSMYFGYGNAETEWTDTFAGIKSAPFDGSGALVGFGAGYNWQMGRWVYGFEADASLTWIKASSPGPFCLCFPAETEVANLITVRGRGGYLIMPNTLVFVTGGLALATLKHGNPNEQTGTAATPGITVGAGIEVQAFSNWTVKGEYLFAKFGETEACGLLVCFGTLLSDYVHVHVFRFALNRYF
jgi:outer membrane immunogenic protein